MRPGDDAAQPGVVLIYTAPGCPDCRLLKQWLTQQALVYTERDLSAPGVADEAKRRYGVRVAPITVIGDHVFYGTFATQRPRIEQVLRSLNRTPPPP
ncbi:MAG: glutaredoxin family protein [Acidiferrobacteraceae bacterium]